MTSTRPKALVIAAHSDDEALGCGGTMSRLAAKGWDVGVVFMTNGVGARPDATSAQAHQRNEAATKAVATLGARVLQSFDFPDNAMDAVPLLRLTQAIEGISRQFMPHLILTHHAHDLNVDHRVVHQATITAFRPVPGSKVEAILCFEVPSSTGWSSSTLPAFHPHLSIDISDNFAAKVAALGCYDVEMRPSPHPRSPQMIEALARYRGSLCGFGMAEAFEVQRMVASSGGLFLSCI